MNKNIALKRRFLVYLIPGFLFFLFCAIMLTIYLGAKNAGGFNFLFHDFSNIFTYVFMSKKLFVVIDYVVLFCVSLLLTFVVALVRHLVEKDKYKLIVNSKFSNTFGEAKFLIDDRENISKTVIKIEGKETDIFSFHKNLNHDQETKFEKQYPSISNIKEPGFLVRNIINPKSHQLISNISTNKHVKVLGVSRSGKTDYWVKPNALLLADLPPDKKPNLFFTDPKGELYNELSGELEKKGYEILVLNLNETTKSMGWQPLKPVYDYLIAAVEFENKQIDHWSATSEFIIKNRINNSLCFEHERVECDVCYENLLIDFRDYKDEMKIFYEKAKNLYFSSVFMKDEYVKIKKRENKEVAEELVNSIAFSMFPPSVDLEHKTWVDNPRNIVKGFIFLMMEIIEKNQAEITLKQFNMVNVAKILSNRTELVQWYNDYASMEDGMMSRSTTELLAPLNARESTTFFNGVAEGLNIFNYLSMQEIFSTNEIDFSKIFDKPTAIFLILPVRSVDKHPLGSLFISQCLDVSTKIAERSPNNKLPRKFFFFLDEIGNMPRINGLETTINVGMSQGFNLALILQTNSQLKDKYGGVAETILNSLQLEIYIKATDKETIEYYVNKAGKKTVFSKSKSYDSKIDMAGKFQNTGSMSETEASLITADQIMNLKKPLIMVFSADANPMISYLIPGWFLHNYADKIYNRIYLSYSSYSIKKKISSFQFTDEYKFNLFSLDPKIYGSSSNQITKSILLDDSKLDIISRMDFKNYNEDLKIFNYYSVEKSDEVTFEEFKWFIYVLDEVIRYEKFNYGQISKETLETQQKILNFYNDNILDGVMNLKDEEDLKYFDEYIDSLLANKSFKATKEYKIYMKNLKKGA